MALRVRYIFVLIVVLMGVLNTGCAKEEMVKPVEKIRQVSVVTINTEAYKETITYTGFVSTRQILPLSFNQDGIVDEVKVTEGQKVKVGDVLMTLKNGTDASSMLYASIDGIVAEVYKKVGDVVGAGYPVLILRTTDQMIQIGVTEDDLMRIEKFENPVVTVDLAGNSKKATLDDINRIPDESSRTYTVTVTLDDQSNQLIGRLGTVSIELSRLSGMWLPINFIQNDGEDFVYIVNSENRVERKNLTLKELNNDRVRVEGLEDGHRIITIGNSIVKEGQQVTAREATNE